MCHAFLGGVNLLCNELNFDIRWSRMLWLSGSNAKAGLTLRAVPRFACVNYLRPPSIKSVRS